MTKTRIDCEDPSISHQARAALVRLRARVARRRGRWQRLLRPPAEEQALPALRAVGMVEAA